MPTRRTGNKTSRQTRKSSSSGASSGTSGRKKTRNATRKQQSTALDLSLRPEHQRELVALALITMALVTLIFFITDTTGGIGRVYILGLTQAFGSGALLVPLVLGTMGLAILLLGRLRDTQFVGATVLGILLVIGALLAALEFPIHHIAYDERFGKGGGLIGYSLVDILDAAIGRPAAVLIVIMLMLAGVLLTFNITLQELLSALAAGLHNMRVAVAYRDELLTAPENQQAKPGKDALTFEAPPQAPDEMVPTPIAARLTRASLFKRNQDGTIVEQPEAQEAKPPPAKASPPAAQPSASAGKAKQNKRAAASAEASGAGETDTQAKGAPEQPRDTEQEQEELEHFDVSPVYHAWPLPALDLLDEVRESQISDDDLKSQARLARLIEETLASFKVEAQVVGVNPGPAVTQFELQPAVGVKISKITSLEKDLALALAAPAIRIEAPIPGKAVLGIEIPNSAIAVVSLREVIDSEEFDTSKGKLKLPLGKDISGIPVVADIAKMPHLLIAGSTGSGKSVAINAFICGLLLKHTPDEMKMIMVDPKMVELIVYNHIPHLLSPVVTELERVVPTLKWATREMERRYKVFARHGCRNLESYKQLARKRADLEPMPYILIVIDELADLMMMAPDEIETYICRLAQMARATGMHLIIATQRPSVDVITGLIKANFPSRIAFAVTSQIDSRVILDTLGAEHLLGRGDMLYMAADAAKLVRIQGTYVSDPEVEQIVSFWRMAKPPGQGDGDSPPPRSAQQAEYEARNAEREQQRRAEQKETADKTEKAQSREVPAEGAAGALDYHPPAAFLSADEQEQLMPQAMELVKQHKRASASLLQRRLRIGYSKAAQLIDLLEQQGIVGPAEGGRSREVIQPDEIQTGSQQSGS